MSVYARRSNNSAGAFYVRGKYLRANQPTTYSQWEAAGFPVPMLSAYMSADFRLKNSFLVNLTGRDLSFRLTHKAPINGSQGLFADNFDKIDEMNIPKGTSAPVSFLPESYILSLSQERIDANGQPYFISDVGKQLSQIQGTTSVVSVTSATGGEIEWKTTPDIRQPRTLVINRTGRILNATISKVSPQGSSGLSECNRSTPGKPLTPDYGAPRLFEGQVDVGSTWVVRVPEEQQRVFVIDPSTNMNPATGALIYRDLSTDQSYDQEATGIMTTFQVACAVLAADGSNGVQLVVMDGDQITPVDSSIVIEKGNHM